MRCRSEGGSLLSSVPKIFTGKWHLVLWQQLIIAESKLGRGSGQISPSFQDRFKLQQNHTKSINIMSAVSTVLFHLVSATKFQVTWYWYTNVVYRTNLVACAEPCTYRPLISRVSRGSPPHSRSTARKEHVALAQQKIRTSESTSIIATPTSASIEWTSISEYHETRKMMNTRWRCSICLMNHIRTWSCSIRGRIPPLLSAEILHRKVSSCALTATHHCWI